MRFAPRVSLGVSEDEYTDIQHSGSRGAGRVRRPLWMIRYETGLQ